MPGVRLELTTYRLPSHFGFRRHAAPACSWAGLSLHHDPASLPGPSGAARLVSTPSPNGGCGRVCGVWLGIGRLRAEPGRSPNLSGSTTGVSAGALVHVKAVALPTELTRHGRRGSMRPGTRQAADAAPLARGRASLYIAGFQGRGHSSVGRAPEWHSGGRRFDSAWLHQTPRIQAGVAATFRQVLRIVHRAAGMRDMADPVRSADLRRAGDRIRIVDLARRPDRPGCRIGLLVPVWLVPVTGPIVRPTAHDAALRERGAWLPAWSPRLLHQEPG